MKTKTILIATAIFLLHGLGFAYGNAIAISTIVVDQTTSKVGFTITWENSWRLASGTASYNWDAAWVFIKFRDCSADPVTTQFTHGTLSATLANHNFDADGVNGALVEPTTSDGATIPGIDADLKGVMLRRTSVGAGTVTETVILNVTNLPATGTLDVRVFGIEMVFIPGGGGGPYPAYFNVGDGDGTNYSSMSFTGGELNTCGAGTGYNSTIITSEAGRWVFRNGWCGNFNLIAGFPKGWNSFYIMKYEITQGQYANFLNTLSDNHAALLFTGNYGTNRNRVNNTGTVPQKYTSDVAGVSKADRACNFLGWKHITSYFDWACLRPLSELQYEKAARGFTTKVAYEYAWGSMTATAPAAAGISGVENGTETITTANACISAGNITYTSGDAGLGPLRVGIFVTSGTSTRQQTGASYFGVLDMSGNLTEFYVAADAGIFGAVSQNGISWGDGTLTAADATHNTADWPSVAAPATNIIRRGGNFTNALGVDSPLKISYRSEGATATGDLGTGGRGGR